MPEEGAADKETDDEDEPPCEQQRTYETLREAAESGLVSAVHGLLAEGVAVNEADPCGRTALRTAAQKGHMAVAIALIRNGAELDIVAFDKRLSARRRPLAPRVPYWRQRRKPTGTRKVTQPQDFDAIDIAPFVFPELYDDSRRAETASQWDETFQRVGFAVIEGHGVSEELIDSLRCASRSFFAQGPDYKLGYFRGMQMSGKSGFSPIGITQDHSDPVEGYTFMRHWAEKWTSSTPHPPELADVGESYAYEMERVMHALHRMSAVALGLDPTFFEPFYTSPASVLVLSHYPPLGPLNVQDGKLRYRAHSDYSGFTVLLQDDMDGSGAGGLEIDINDTWVPVKPRKGCFVVNIGDLFETWTNDRWRSTPHRVSSPRLAAAAASRSRHTAMLFSGPNLDAVIRPIKTCVDAEHPLRYAPIKAAEHLKAQYQTKSKEANYEPG